MKTVIYFLSFKEVSTDDHTNLSSFNEYGNIKYETEKSVFTIIITTFKSADLKIPIFDTE